MSKVSNIIENEMEPFVALNVAYFDVVDTDDMLVVRVGGQPRDNSLRASDATGSHARGAHVGGVAAYDHGASGVTRRTARSGH